jgi:glucose-6-phosphate 1-dehydrogenase
MDQPLVAPSVIVIFGASGDLTSRKLMPALAELIDRGFLSPQFSVVGVARTEMSDDDFRARMTAAVENAPASWESAAARFRYLTGEYTAPETFTRLKEVLNELEVSMGGVCNRLYYFAAPPSTFPILINSLGAAGLNHPTTPGGFVRVIIEKPYGRDSESARTLDEVVHAVFDESQVYRIDHYLGKETVQNLLALRFANAIFEPLWNRQYVDHVEVTVAESLGVGHRGGFYEEAGALRDIVQNHVMQVLALVLMEAPVRMDANGIRDEKVKALRSVVSIAEHDVEQRVVRAQYEPGLSEGEKVVGYRGEEGVSPSSHTETFLAMRLTVDNWRWAGVPIYVRTGKRLPKRLTEVVMHFRPVPPLGLRSEAFQEARTELAHRPNSARLWHFLAVRGQGPGPSVRSSHHVDGFRLRRAVHGGRFGWI